MLMKAFSVIVAINGYISVLFVKKKHLKSCVTVMIHFFFFSDYDENSISCITLDSTKIQKSFVTPPEKLVYMK